MKLYRLFVIFAGIACLSIARLSVAETCDFASLNIPDTEAMVLVQSLVKKGDVFAQAQLGRAYLRGYGVEKDIAKAITLLEKSAASDNKDAQYLLGEHFDKNGKTDKDFQKAAGWLKRSADQGCLQALLLLGMLTQEGKGVPKDNDAGLQMIYKSAEAGLPMAQWWLGAILITGNGVKKDIKAGFNWTKKAADTGYSAAQISLADLYLTGIGAQPNSEAAVSLLEKVYVKKDEQATTAAYSLGWMYMEGKGVPVDIIEAFRWMIIAANAGVSDSEKRFKTLTEQLTKQKLATACSVYLDPSFATSGAKEYIHVDAGETVACLNAWAASSEVYFPDRHLLGYIAPQCLDVAGNAE